MERGREAAADRVIGVELFDETLPHEGVVVGSEESGIIEISKNPAARWRFDLN